MKPRDVLARLPGWSGVDVVVEGQLGGLTNRTYKVSRRGEPFVLRLDADHTQAFSLDRDRELAILQAASGAALAPEVVYADSDRGIVIRRFVEGRVWSGEDLRERPAIESIAALLRRVHRLPTSGRQFDAHAIAGRYLERLEGEHELHATGQRCVRLIDESHTSARFVTCHNDVVAENIISGKTLILIDWEYACDNDPRFDLASLIRYHDMDEAGAERLLDAYAGGVTPELRERLNVQMRTYDVLQWLWFAVRETVHPDAGQRRRLETLKRRLL